MSVMEKLEGLLPAEPTACRFAIERIEGQGDATAWCLDFVLRNTVQDGWVQLAHVVLSFDGHAWRGPDGRVQVLEGWVVSAEGRDAEGRSWKLRRMAGQGVVWRVEEGSGELGLRFDRRLLSTAAGRPTLDVHEYWARRVRPGLQIEGESGLAWTPVAGFFAGWRGDDAR